MRRMLSPITNRGIQLSGFGSPRKSGSPAAIDRSKSEPFGELFRFARTAFADRAAGAGQQCDVAAGHGFSVAVAGRSTATAAERQRIVPDAAGR
jgi:hypothetical protein